LQVEAFLHSHPSKNSSRHQQPPSPPRFLPLWFSHDSFISSQGVGAIPMAELTSLPRACQQSPPLRPPFPLLLLAASSLWLLPQSAPYSPVAPMAPAKLEQPSSLPWRPLQARQQEALLPTAAPSVRCPCSKTRRAPWRLEIFPVPPCSSSLPCCCSPLPPFP
jgi:hypothetical protein